MNFTYLIPIPLNPHQNLKDHITLVSIFTRPTDNTNPQSPQVTACKDDWNFRMKALISGSCRILRSPTAQPAQQRGNVDTLLGKWRCFFCLGFRLRKLLGCSCYWNYKGLKQNVNWKLSAESISSMCLALFAYMIGWYWYQMIYYINIFFGSQMTGLEGCVNRGCTRVKVVKHPLAAVHMRLERNG